ncbi:MAG: flagellar basal body rod protein FlgB [Planctomycetota bacterium]
MSSRGIFPVSVDVLTKSLSFAQERHRIIANNIANANTPFFKGKRAPVAEFREALSDAIECSRADRSRPLTMANSSHVRERGGALEIVPVEDVSRDAVLRHDGNNVNLEHEMAALAENTLMYRTFADLLRKQFAMLRAAIRERVD